MELQGTRKKSGRQEGLSCAKPECRARLTPVLTQGQGLIRSSGVTNLYAYLGNELSSLLALGIISSVPFLSSCARRKGWLLPSKSS